MARIILSDELVEQVASVQLWAQRGSVCQLQISTAALPLHLSKMTRSTSLRILQVAREHQIWRLLVQAPFQRSQSRLLVTGEVFNPVIPRAV